MPLDFPTSPALNELYTFNGKTWKWDGAGWESYNVAASGAGSGGGISGPYVISVNGVTGIVGISAGDYITIATVGQTLTISSSASITPIGNFVSSFNGYTGGITLFAGTGITFTESARGITFTSTIPNITNTFSEIQNFNRGISSFGATFTGNIILQNEESIRNTTNGSIDFYPRPTTFSGATLWGIRFDMSTSGSGVRLNLIKAETGEIGVTSQANIFMFQRPISVSNDIDFIFGANSTSKIRHFTTTPSGVTGPAYLQIGVGAPSSTESSAVGIMRSTHFDTTGRIIGITHTNPNLYIFSGNNGSTLQYIRFEHDQNDANIISGVGGIDLFPQTIVRVNGGLSASNLNIVGGSTFQGNITAPNIVNFINGYTGGITLFAGEGISLQQSINGLTFSINIVDGGTY